MDVVELWWLSLAIAAVVVVVVAVLLGLVIGAAKNIERQAAGIWITGKQIAGNTVTIWVLEKIDGQVESLHRAASDLDRSVADLHQTLRALARSGNRH